MRFPCLAGEGQGEGCPTGGRSAWHPLPQAFSASFARLDPARGKGARPPCLRRVRSLMRVVGGRLKGRNLASPASRDIRPTADRLREITRSEEHTSELQSHSDLVCRLL